MDITNRTIWTLWCQGFDHAPPLVRACLGSWQQFNPDWRICALDRDTLRDWINLQDVVDLTRSDLTVQKISDIARLCLLRQYGGVWADATVFCLRPLDSWVTEYYSTGFCAFRNPGPDRLMSSWFIATEKDNPILTALQEAFVEFMNSRIFSNQNTELGLLAIQKLEPILKKNVRRTIRWLNPRLQERVQAYPYFIFHYAFNKIILTNPKLRLLWEQALPLDARPSHSLQTYSRDEHGLARALSEIDRSDWMLQKLDWRADLTAPYWGEVLKRLIDFVSKRAPQRVAK